MEAHRFSGKSPLNEALVPLASSFQAVRRSGGRHPEQARGSPSPPLALGFQFWSPWPARCLPVPVLEQPAPRSCAGVPGALWESARTARGCCAWPRRRSREARPLRPAAAREAPATCPRALSGAEPPLAEKGLEGTEGSATWKTQVHAAAGTNGRTSLSARTSFTPLVDRLPDCSCGNRGPLRRRRCWITRNAIPARAPAEGRCRRSSRGSERAGAFRGPDGPAGESGPGSRGGTDTPAGAGSPES